MHSSAVVLRQAEDKLSFFKAFRIEAEQDFVTFQGALEHFRLKLKTRKNFLTFEVAEYLACMEPDYEKL